MCLTTWELSDINFIQSEKLAHSGLDILGIVLNHMFKENVPSTSTEGYKFDFPYI